MNNVYEMELHIKNETENQRKKQGRHLQTKPEP